VTPNGHDRADIPLARRSRRTLAAAVALCACFAAAAGPGNAEDLGKGVAAVVNGQLITVDQVRDRLADIFFDAYAKQALEDLIKVALVKQEARNRGKHVSEEEITQRINSIADEQIENLRRKRGFKTLRELDQDLKKHGVSITQLKEKIRRNLRTARHADIEATLLAHKMIAESTHISESELREEYNQIYGEKIEARQIVVKSRTQAENIEQQLRMGADFATLARRESIDRRSAAAGGKMRPFAPGVGTLGKAAAALKSGTISPIVRTEDGYHILQVIRRIRPENADFEKVKPRLKTRILDRRMGDWIIGLMESAKINRAFE